MSYFICRISKNGNVYFWNSRNSRWENYVICATCYKHKSRAKFSLTKLKNPYSSKLSEKIDPENLKIAYFEDSEIIFDET